MENHKIGYFQRQYHRVPSSPPEETVLSNRTVPGSSHLKRDPSQEIASVLLMAAAAATSVKEIRTSGSRGDGDNQDTEIVGSRPLKKRKSEDRSIDNVSGETRNHSDDTYHVSPISHSSKSGATVESNNRSHDTPSTSSAHSFDMKEDAHSNNIDGSCMKESQSHLRKQNSMYQMIPQFPSLVHWILSEPSAQSGASKFAVDLSVLQWVSHGQAWRIIRWDAFHREVLPTLFPQLVSNVTDTGSIDAFMWQLKAWGFQEIKDGPDIGAFAHTVRASYYFWEFSLIPFTDLLSYR